MCGAPRCQDDRVNVAMRAVSLPLMLLSTIILLAYLPAWTPLETAFDGLPIFVQRSLDVSAGSMLVLLYASVYFAWDKVAGLTWAAFTGFPVLLLAFFISDQVGEAWAVAVGLIVLACYLQIYPGHLVFEKRKPAVLDRLVQAFVTAPLFGWLQILFVLDYRPELKAELKAEFEAAEQRMVAQENPALAKPLIAVSPDSDAA